MKDFASEDFSRLLRLLHLWPFRRLPRNSRCTPVTAVRAPSLLDASMGSESVGRRILPRGDEKKATLLKGLRLCGASMIPLDA
jgi:hypothetical protein